MCVRTVEIDDARGILVYAGKNRIVSCVGTNAGQVSNCGGVACDFIAEDLERDRKFHGVICQYKTRADCEFFTFQDAFFWLLSLQQDKSISKHFGGFGAPRGEDGGAGTDFQVEFSY